MRTVDDVIARLPRPEVARLPPPPYAGAGGACAGLAVESMRRHTSDEGIQLFDGLHEAGYMLVGRGLPIDETDVKSLLTTYNLGTVVLQDHREWDLLPRDFRDPAAAFLNVDRLRRAPEVFTLTLLKDAHQRPTYHRESMEEIGCHGVICYYHPRIVSHLAPYVRPEHLVRTYHTVDARIVPEYSPNGRAGCLLSGAVSGAYPLRKALIQAVRQLPETDYLPHPGYHRDGCCTPAFLQRLKHYKVAICTSSVYGYALRKIVEATACGCVVITDLPGDEVLPLIDDNLIRIRPDTSPRDVGRLLRLLYAEYDPARQADFARRAVAFYDYRVMGRRLADDIEALRKAYPCN